MNNLEILEEKYNKLSSLATKTLFSNNNFDNILLADFLYKEGFISKTQFEYIRTGEIIVYE